MKTLATFVGIAALGILPSLGLARQPAAPTKIESKQSLPSRYPYVVEDILRFCKPIKGFWVDLGAGKGQVAIPLIEATGNPVVMLDPNGEAMTEGLRIAREKKLEDRLSAVVGRAEAMPFPDNTVDLVVSRGSIFFWDYPAKGLKEVYRVLRPGGKAYIGGGAGSGYPKWAVEKLIQQRKDKIQGDEAEKGRRFVELRSPEQMKQWAKEAGLHEFEVMGEGAISSQDERTGQGVWLLFEKKPKEVPEQTRQLEPIPVSDPSPKKRKPRRS
jgi:SAM-dependent methyltransferase